MIKLAALPQLLLPVLAAGAVWAGGLSTVEDAPMEIGVGSEVEQAIADEVAASKPVNTWTTEALEDAGWIGCEAIDWDAAPDFSRTIVKHVVRLSAAEGYTYMSPAEVARRTEALGGTTTTKDDVRLIANCY